MGLQMVCLILAGLIVNYLSSGFCIIFYRFHHLQGPFFSMDTDDHTIIHQSLERCWRKVIIFVYLPTLLIRHRHLTKGHLVHWKPVGKKYITSLLVKSQVEWLFDFHFQNYWKKLGSYKYPSWILLYRDLSTGQECCCASEASWPTNSSKSIEVAFNCKNYSFCGRQNINLASFNDDTSLIPRPTCKLKYFNLQVGLGMRLRWHKRDKKDHFSWVFITGWT